MSTQFKNENAILVQLQTTQSSSAWHFDINVTGLKEPQTEKNENGIL